jgi:lambda family phage tail tape measure protein
MTNQQAIGLDLIVNGEDTATAALKRMSAAQEVLSQKIKVSVDASTKKSRSLDQVTVATKKAENEIKRHATALSQGVITGKQYQGEINKIASRLKAMGLENAQSKVMSFGRSVSQATRELQASTAVIKQVEAANKGLSASTDRVSASKVRVAAAAKSATDATSRTRQAFLNTANSVAILDGPLGGIASRFSALGVLIGRTGFLLGGLLVSFSTLGVAISRSVRTAITAETAMLSLQGAIRATGGAAGLTAKDIEGIARSIEAATLTSREAVREAATQLLTFEGIAGPMFERVLRISQDVAQAFGKDITSVSLQVAKALENPRQSLSSLERAYGALTPGIREAAIAMTAQGRQGEAMSLIMEDLERRFMGLGAAAAGGMAGGLDTLSAAFTDLQEKIFEVVNGGGRFEAAVKAITSAVEALTRAIDRIDFERVVSYSIAIGAIMVGRLVPSIVAVIFSIRTLTAATALLGAALIRLPFVALVVASGEIINIFRRLMAATGGWAETISLLGDVAAGVWEGIKTSAKSIGPALQAVWETVRAGFFGMLESVSRRWADFLHGITGGMANIPGMEATTLALSEAAIKAGSSVYAFGAAADKASDNASRFKKEAESLASQGFDKARAALDLLTDALNKVEDADEDVIDATNRVRRSFDEAASAGGKAAKAIVEKLTEAEKRLQGIADSIGNAMTNSLMSIVERTASVKDAFKAMASDIIKELYKVLIVQRLVGGFDVKSGTRTGIVGAIIGAFQADGGAWQNGRQVNSYANGAAFSGGNVVPFANGGVVGSPTTFPMAGGKTGLMGEAGPEAIMPLKRGKDGKLGVAADGGGTVVVNNHFNISANGDDSVKRIVRQQIPQIAEATKAAVVDAKRRGGSYGRAFG